MKMFILYTPQIKKNFRKKIKKIDKIDNPFRVLSQLNLK